jgi:hypothetical protein
MIRHKSDTQWSDDQDIVYDPHRTRGGDKKRGFPDLASKSVATVW